MTRNDFEIIASVLRERMENAGESDKGVVIGVCHAFADRLKLINPRFNRALFLKACGASETKR
jgi:hypothetical protein